MFFILQVEKLFYHVKWTTNSLYSNFVNHFTEKIGYLTFHI